MDDRLDQAAHAAEMWALSTRRLRAEEMRLTSNAPFPSSLYTGLAWLGLPSQQIRTLIADLTALVEGWERHEAGHQDRLHDELDDAARDPDRQDEIREIVADIDAGHQDQDEPDD